MAEDTLRMKTGQLCNFRTEIRPLKGWKINADFAYNTDIIETTNVDKNIWIYDLDNKPYAHGVGLPNGILRQKYTKKYWTTNIFTSYDFDIKEDHHFTVLAGMQFEKGNVYKDSGIFFCQY